MTRLRLQKFAPLSAALLTVIGLPYRALAHAFPIRSDPRVGWMINSSPAKVTIWFDGELESAFSTIAVYNSAKQQVDKANSHVNLKDATMLEVDLPNLAPGTYRVYWKVLAKDTHVTEGDFSFAIEKKQP
jgi:methionine-rich copper-binding protein CopC